MPQAFQADLLLAMLENQGMSQTELSAATGVADSNISAILAGRRRIRQANRITFARVLKVRPDRFLVGCMDFL